MTLNYDQLDASFNTLRARWPEAKPRAGLVLGSGLGQVVSQFTIYDSVPYSELPAMGSSTVQGHAGQVSWGTLNGVETFIFEGRRHYYEGAGWTPVSLPMYLLKRFGAEFVFLTHAAGGLGDDIHPGDFMLIRDHINFMGSNPLIGEHNEVWGPRFPDLTHCYDEGLSEQLLKAASNAGETLKQGVMCAWSGPCYETPAEIRMMKQLGGGSVGMSLAPSAILAAAAGIRAVGISCITNYAAGISGTPLSHTEVMEMGKKVEPRLKALVSGFFDLVESAD